MAIVYIVPLFRTQNAIGVIRTLTFSPYEDHVTRLYRAESQQRCSWCQGRGTGKRGGVGWGGGGVELCQITPSFEMPYCSIDQREKWHSHTLH
jgi:hypothetical protein